MREVLKRLKKTPRVFASKRFWLHLLFFIIPVVAIAFIFPATGEALTAKVAERTLEIISEVVGETIVE